MVSKKVEDRRRRQQESRGAAVPGDVQRVGYATGVAAVCVAALAACLSFYSPEDSASEGPASTAARQQRMRDFQQFPAAIQLQAAEGVGLVHRDGWGYALQAQRNLTAHSRLLSLPLRHTLSVHSVLLSPLIRKVMDRYQLDIEAKLSNEFAFHQFALTVGLLAEKHGLRNTSLYAPWLAVLPTPRQQRNDLYWGPQELACLPPLPRRAKERRDKLVRSMHACIQQYFTRYDAFWKESVTLSEVMWAYSVVISRAWWRDEPDHLAIYPVLDVADQRARHYGGAVWRPLPVNAKLTVDGEGGSAHLVSSSDLKKGDFVSMSPLVPLLPSHASPMFGVVDPDFTHAMTHIDLSEIDPQNCTQDDMLVHRNGTLTDRTKWCLLKYRDIPDHAPEAVKDKVIRNFASVHAGAVLKDWTLPSTGPCSAREIGSMSYGTEVLDLIVAHAEAYQRMRDTYAAKPRR